MSFSEQQFASLRSDTADHIQAYLLDSDGLDAVFFLHAVVLYTLVRLGFDVLLSGFFEAAACGSTSSRDAAQHRLAKGQGLGYSQ